MEPFIRQKTETRRRIEMGKRPRGGQWDRRINSFARDKSLAIESRIYWAGIGDDKLKSHIGLEWAPDSSTRTRGGKEVNPYDDLSNIEK